MSKYCVGDVCEYDTWGGIGMCIILWDGHIASLHKDDVCIIIRATKLYAFAYKHAPLDQY